MVQELTSKIKELLSKKYFVLLEISSIEIILYFEFSSGDFIIKLAKLLPIIEI